MEKKKDLSFKQFMNKESTAGVVFCLPFIIGFLAFMIVPMGISLYYSFCDYNILSPATFTGLKNFIKMFTEDEVFYKTIGVTFYFALVSVPAASDICFNRSVDSAKNNEGNRLLPGRILPAFDYWRFRSSSDSVAAYVCHRWRYQ